MTTRKLTPENIDYLFRIVEQNGVKYYDVQVEMVDHFASAVERNWERNPYSTFAESFTEEYKQLKNIDFELIQAEKETALQKKYLKIEHKYLINFFSWPKILATAFATFVIFQFFSLSFNYFILTTWFVAADYALVILFSFIVYPQIFNIRLNDSKEFLLLKQMKSRVSHFRQVGRLPSTIMLVLIFLHRDFHFAFIENPAFRIFVAFLIVMSVVFFIATGYYIPQRIKADFIREYPQFVKV